MVVRLARGAMAGLMATAVMTSAQTELVPAVSKRLEGLFDGGNNQPLSAEQGEQEPEQESSPALVARRIARFLGTELSPEEAATWGNRIHWLCGMQWGVVFTLLWRRHGLGTGLLFGSVLWLASDELMLWALGIAKAPTQYPLPMHMKALAAHLAYGAAVAVAAKGLR
jgi:uncharacterized membrane protein YagU involved in acid resistance